MALRTLCITSQIVNSFNLLGQRLFSWARRLRLACDRDEPRPSPPPATGAREQHSPLAPHPRGRGRDPRQREGEGHYRLAVRKERKCGRITSLSALARPAAYARQNGSTV